MELAELKNNIVKNKLSSLYVFTGEEIAIRQIYVDKISEVTGKSVVHSDSVASVFSKLQNSPIISSSRCYVIHDDRNYLTQEKVWPSLKDGIIQGQNIIILIYTKVQSNTKFYKFHEDRLVEFGKLPVQLLISYIQKESDLNNKNSAQLVQLCGNDYSRILLECDKLRHLARKRKVSFDVAYKQALEENLIFVSASDAIFDLVEAICKRQVQSVYTLLNHTKRIDESPLAIISVLYNNIRQMMLVSGAGNCSNICEKTGLTSYQVNYAKQKGNNYTLEELVYALRVIREAERGIKIGTMEASMAVDYILVNIL